MEKVETQENLQTIGTKNSEIEIAKGSFEKKQRQTGFEILRILAIFMICCVHTMNYGGMLTLAGGGTVKSQFWQWLVYSVFAPSVNVFVLITGYFMAKSKFKPRKLISMYVQVLFYSVVPYLMAKYIFDVEFKTGLFRMFFPITNNVFWFFTGYIMIYCLSPFLNMVLSNATKKQLQWLLGVTFVVVCLAMHFDISMLASVNIGYSIIWFMVLYMFGAYFRLYPLKIKKIWFLLIYLACTVGTWLFSAYKVDLWDSVVGSEMKTYWLGVFYQSPDYTSPMVIIASFCLLHLFKDVTIKNKWVHNSICFVSSCVFGIYLFHTSYITVTLYGEWLNISQYFTKPYPALNVLWFSLQLFLVSFGFEVCRKLLFKGCDVGYKFTKKKFIQLKIKKQENSDSVEPVIVKAEQSKNNK